MAFNKRSAVNKSLEIGQWSAGLELERGTEAPPVNSARAELLTIRILIATEHSSIQALTEFHFRFGANR